MPDETIWGGQGPKPRPDEPEVDPVDRSGIQYVDDSGAPEEGTAREEPEEVDEQTRVLHEFVRRGNAAQQVVNDLGAGPPGTSPEDAHSVHADVLEDAGDEIPPEPVGERFPPGRIPLFEGELPDDIAEVWGHGRLDGLGQLAENTARTLINAWGMETFRTSAIHLAAIQSLGREAAMDPMRKAFIDAKGKKH